MYCPQCGHQTDGGNFVRNADHRSPVNQATSMQLKLEPLQSKQQNSSVHLSYPSWNALIRNVKQQAENSWSAQSLRWFFSVCWPLWCFIFFFRRSRKRKLYSNLLRANHLFYFISIWPACMHLFRPENRGKPSVFQGFILKIRSISYSFYGYFDSCPFLLFITYRHLLYHISRWFNRCILRHSSCDAEQLPAFI